MREKNVYLIIDQEFYKKASKEKLNIPMFTTTLNLRMPRFVKIETVGRSDFSIAERYLKLTLNIYEVLICSISTFKVQ